MLGLVLRHAFLHELGRAVDQILLLQTQLVTSRTTLITLIFLSPAFVRLNRELGLLSRRAGAAPPAAAAFIIGAPPRGHAPLLLERLHKLAHLQHAQIAERFAIV